MRIKDYRRISAVGTVAFIIVLCAGAVVYYYGHVTSGVVLMIVGVAGAIIASAAIRLYGKMSMAAFFQGRELEK